MCSFYSIVEFSRDIENSFQKKEKDKVVVGMKNRLHSQCRSGVTLKGIKSCLNQWTVGTWGRLSVGEWGLQVNGGFQMLFWSLDRENGESSCISFYWGIFNKYRSAYGERIQDLWLKSDY